MNRTLPPTIQSKLSPFVNELAVLLCALPTDEVMSVMLTVMTQVVDEMQKLNAAAVEVGASGEMKVGTATNPSDVGAPSVGPKPIPVPPEVLSAALASFNEEEIIEGIREIRSGRGHKLEDFIQELRKAAVLSNDSLGS